MPKISVWKDAINKSEKYFNRNFKHILDVEVTNPLLDKKDLLSFSRSFLENIKNMMVLFVILQLKKILTLI